MPGKKSKKGITEWFNPFPEISRGQKKSEKATSKKTPTRVKPKIDYAARVKERPPKSGTTKTTVKQIAPKKASVKPAPKKASVKPASSRRTRRK